jgi:hypothetical protein
MFIENLHDGVFEFGGQCKEFEREDAKGFSDRDW